MFRPDVDPADGTAHRTFEVRGDIVQIPIGKLGGPKPAGVAASIALRAEAIDPDGCTIAPLNRTGQISEEPSRFATPWPP
jgi:hypothetical protein